MTTTTELRALFERAPFCTKIERDAFSVTDKNGKQVTVDELRMVGSTLPGLLSAAEELERVKAELREADVLLREASKELHITGSYRDARDVGLGMRITATAHHEMSERITSFLARRASKESR